MNNRDFKLNILADSLTREDIFGFKPFAQWLNKLPESFELHSIDVTDVDFFGKDPISGKGRIGFLKFKADITNLSTNKKIPGIVFMRGPAVAILIILICEGVEHAVLVRQPRAPIATNWFPELPAGMLDGLGNFGGVAAKEIAEETGLNFAQSDLILMKEEMYPSCGACDEYISFFLARRNVDKEFLLNLDGQLHGEGDHETTKVMIVKYDEILEKSSDMKLFAAKCLYDEYKKKM